MSKQPFENVFKDKQNEHRTSYIQKTIMYCFGNSIKKVAKLVYEYCILNSI